MHDFHDFKVIMINRVKKQHLFLGKKCKIFHDAMHVRIRAGKISFGSSKINSSKNGKRGKFFKIPNDIVLKCQQLMNILGLCFDAFDLAVDKQGKFYFFEINANGQWYWLEKETGALISHAISDMLISESEIYKTRR